MNQRKRFGQILLEAGVLNEATLQQALERQRGSGKRLGEILEEMGVVSEKDIATALARQFGFKTVTGFAKFSFPEAVLNLVEAEKALKVMIFPLKVEERLLYLAMSNPLDMETIDSLSFRTGLRIIPCISTAREIREAINKHYLKETPADEMKKAEWWSLLVVDDQDMVRAAIAATLKRAGYQIVEATNGAEGLKAALQSPPHLIVTDTVMPRMDGYEMFRALQSNSSTRKIPVIALSSKSSPEEEARLLDMGYFDFIPKPINPIRLTARVKRALRIVYGERPPG
ncbi:MAG: response regulator [Desulfuromonadales bacterium]|nr:response regulator [Desulfuromonadales bacterium]